MLWTVNMIMTPRKKRIDLPDFVHFVWHLSFGKMYQCIARVSGSVWQNERSPPLR